MAVSKPLLLLDNASMFRPAASQAVSVTGDLVRGSKAIIEMHAAVGRPVLFNAEIEQLPWQASGRCIRSLNYAHPWRTWRWDQDAIAFRLLCHAVGDAAQYPHGVRQYEATKVQNLLRVLPVSPTRPQTNG